MAQSHDYIIISIESSDEIELFANFYDMQGNLLIAKEIDSENNIESITMDIHHYLSGMYILKILSKTQVVKSLTIMKIN